MRALLLATTLASIMLAGGVARADDEAAATELFNAGRDLMKQGDYAAACPKLAESVRLKATVGALAKLATCEEHEKRLASAYARWQQALNLAQSTRDERAPEVQRELARVDKVVPKLTVKAAGALPADASIRVDDTTLGAASLGVPLPVEPGPHTVAATAPGKKPWSTTVTTAADGATTAVDVPSLEDAPAPPSTPPLTPPQPQPQILTPTQPLTPPPAPTPAGSSPWPIVGIVAGAAGLASIAGGAVLGFVAMGKRNDANCPNNTCPDAAHASTLGDAKTAADWSTGLFVAGGVLAAAGVTVWVVSHGHESAPQVGATVLPGGVGFAMAGGWN
jgi:serine/threonine-protein kinase